MLVFFSKINDANELHKIPVVLRLALPNDNVDTSEYVKTFSAPSSLNEWKKENKKFITIYLTGDVIDDDKRFDLIRYEARKIKYTCDTNTIIKVHFTSENTYGQFVKLVNMMVEDQHKRYMYYKDDFYIIPEPFLDSSYGIIESDLLPSL